MGAPSSRPLSGRVWLLAMAGLVSLGAAVRLVGWGQVFRDEGLARLVDPDSYLHAWRTAEASQSFPRLPPWREPRLGHPEGVSIGWPPALDYVAGGLARAGGLDPDGEGAARLGTLLVVLLGSLLGVVVAGVARRLAGPGWALLAGAWIALWPMLVEYSRIGRLDHHVLEPLLSVLAVLLLLEARARAGRALVPAVQGGLVLGLALWSWPTALLPVSLIALVFLVDAILRSDRRPLLAVALLAALLMLTPLCLAGPHRARFALHAPSALHLVAVGALLLAAALTTLSNRCLARPRVPSALLTLLLLGLPLAALPVGEALRLGLSFGGRGGLWGLLLEQRPILALPGGDVVLLLTCLGLALPALLALAFIAPVDRAGELRILGALALSLLGLGVAQVRFLPLGLAMAAPLAAVGVAELSRRLATALAPARARARRALPALAAAGSLALLSPGLGYLCRADRRHLEPPGGPAAEEAAAWLRAHPAKGAVLAEPGTSNLLLYRARVPIVATALIDPSTDAANRAALALLTGPDSPSAHRLFVERGIGRVLVSPMPLRRHARLRRFLGEEARSESAAAASYRRSLVQRLLVDGGASRRPSGEEPPAVRWLEEEWASRPRPGVLPVKIFRVTGLHD